MICSQRKKLGDGGSNGRLLRKVRKENGGRKAERKKKVCSFSKRGSFAIKVREGGDTGGAELTIGGEGGVF